MFEAARGRVRGKSKRCHVPVPWQKLIKVKEKQLTQKMRGFSGNLTIFANGM